MPRMSANGMAVLQSQHMQQMQLQQMIESQQRSAEKQQVQPAQQLARSKVALASAESRD